MDAQVILHVSGHAIQDNGNPGFNNPRSELGEGFGDLLAVIYYDDKHRNSRTRGLMFSWDAAPFGAGSWPGRKYNMNWYLMVMNIHLMNIHQKVIKILIVRSPAKILCRLILT